ncbi:monofunctional biosynthetic peptidoglycan transglycosylase [Tianweitania sediminis]
MSIPAVEPEQEPPMPPKGRGPLRSRRPATHWFKRILQILVVLVLIPLGLTIVYAVPGVRPVSTLMLRDAVTLEGYDRRWVPIEEIAPALRYSVIMSEDGQFCSHRGIDLREMQGVIEDALAGKETRGASTIPMQTVKNLFLWNSRSFIRKGLEAPLAVYLDLVLSKRRILEIYLNIVEWGPGIYGAESASLYHFGKAAADLSAREAALLAVALPNPLERNPGKPTRNLLRLADRVQGMAARSGGYTGCVR